MSIVTTVTTKRSEHATEQRKEGRVSVRWARSPSIFLPETSMAAAAAHSETLKPKPALLVDLEVMLRLGKLGCVVEEGTAAGVGGPREERGESAMLVKKSGVFCNVVC